MTTDEALRLRQTSRELEERDHRLRNAQDHEVDECAQRYVEAIAEHRAALGAAMQGVPERSMF